MVYVQDIVLQVCRFLMWLIYIYIMLLPIVKNETFICFRCHFWLLWTERALQTSRLWYWHGLPRSVQLSKTACVFIMYKQMKWSYHVEKFEASSDSRPLILNPRTVFSKGTHTLSSDPLRWNFTGYFSEDSYYCAEPGCLLPNVRLWC